MDVHLVDGTYELFRCFYGAPPHKNAKGEEVGAVRGLASTLLSLLRVDGSRGATHVGVAFDTVIESFRNELFDGYKTSAGIDKHLWAQFPIAEECTRALGLVTWSMIDFEADDALAAMAHKARARADVDTILLCSPDKDLCQCVSGKRTVLFDRKQDKILDEQAVIDKFGVPPAAIPDYLALVGDTADGIPGLAGIGARSAAQLLSTYGRLEDIPADASTWKVKPRGADKIARTLVEGAADARLYKRLATLRTDVPLAESVDDLCWRGPSPTFASFCAERLESTALVERAQERARERAPQGRAQPE